MTLILFLAILAWAALIAIGLVFVLLASKLLAFVAAMLVGVGIFAVRLIAR